MSCQGLQDKMRVGALDSPNKLFNAPTLIQVERVPTFDASASGSVLKTNLKSKERVRASKEKRMK